MEKQRWLCCTSSHSHWLKDTSWAPCWGLSITATARTAQCHCHTAVWVYQKYSLQSGWCHLCSNWHCLLTSPSPEDFVACDIYFSGGTKAPLSLQQSVFIGCSNKSSELGSIKWYDCLVCQALSNTHCCASISPPMLLLFGTAEPLIAFAALIRAEVLQLGCLSFRIVLFAAVYSHIYLYLN